MTTLNGGNIELLSSHDASAQQGKSKPFRRAPSAAPVFAIPPSPRLISVLCAARNSVYHTLDGVDVFDNRRDARTFDGSTPIIGHPPCRAWSAFCSHQAKPEPGEKSLGLWVCQQLKQCGGVLEQPAHSRLFAAAGLPLPGEPPRGGLWSIAVNQYWWGFPTKKATWLAFCTVPQDAVDVPMILHNQQRDRAVWNRQSKNQRSATCEAFALWLIAAARSANMDVSISP